ncbi:MAG: SLC13 family permease [Aestuariivirgaceae bacterium]
MQMWATFAVVGVAIALFATELAALELVALGVIAALLVLFQIAPLVDSQGANLLAPDLLLSGFANPALITILALLVIGQGLHQSGALDGLISRLASLGRGRAGLMLSVTLLVAGIVSAFMNNTPVVVMFIPVVAALANRFGKGAASMLMPLSFMAILGGMLTLIGSSTNLLVAEMVRHPLGRQMDFFELLVPGSILAAVGAVYILTIAPRLLAGRSNETDPLSHERGRQFIAQLDITADHQFAGAESVAGMFRELQGMTVQMIERNRKTILPPFEDIVLSPGDTIVLATTRRALVSALNLRENLDQGQYPTFEQGDQARPSNEDWLIAEAAVAPGSRLSGRFVSPAAFWSRTGCRIIGVQRHKRMARKKLVDVRLETGDVLLIAGSSRDMAELRRDRDLLVLEGSISDLPAQFSARRALVVFVATILASATGMVPIVVATIIGALAMVALRCLNIQQASRAINLQIVLLVAAGIAMAVALQATGGAMYLATGILKLFAATGKMGILSAFFLLVAVMTNVLSNNATALIFTPIAISSALQLGIEPTPFVHAVIFAANCSFVSPIGYQTNLLVMGPGNYRYMDFVKVGTPLALLIWLTFCLIAPWYYNL